MEKEIVQCDVLVIGSGLAGVRAAIEAGRNGRDTLLVDKSILARASATIYAGSLVARRPPEYLVKRGLIEPGMDLEKPFDQTFRYFVKEGARTGGSEYTAYQRVSMTVACEMQRRTDELRDFGVKEIYAQMWLGPVGRKGREIILPMLRFAQKNGVKTREMTVITDFIRQSEDIVGAVGYDIQKERFVVIRAKSVVMATGSQGQLYERSYAPVRMTGDGYAMAYRAGASLSDMEMMGFDNWGLAVPGIPQYWIPPSIARVSGEIRNAKGEAFFLKFAQEQRIIGKGATLSQNDSFSKRYGRPFIELIPYLIKACQMEILKSGAGETGSVFIDLTNVPEEKMYLDHNGVWTLNILRGFDWRNKPIPIAPICMGDFKGGGARIDENGKTDVKGLFASGDVAPGSSLLYALVTGVLAGRSAVNRAIDVPMPEFDAQTNEWVEDRKGDLETIFNRKPNKEGDPEAIKKEVKKIMWRAGGPLREEKGLKQGIVGLEQLGKESLPMIYASGSPRKLREAVEAINMVKVGLIILSSSLYRTESRGYNQRLDYPERDDKNWLSNTIINQQNGGMKISSDPVDMVFIKPEGYEETGK